MKLLKFIKAIILIIILSLDLYPKSHYSLEHSEELKKSGEIKWREYGPELFKEAINENKAISYVNSNNFKLSINYKYKISELIIPTVESLNKIIKSYTNMKKCFMKMLPC